MKKVNYLMAVLLAFSSAAFAVDNKTVAGAVVGGVAGAVIGNEVGGEKGAVIGAAIGGVTGAVIAGKKSNATLAPQAPQPGVVQVQPQPALAQPQPVAAYVQQPVADERYDGEGKLHRNGNRDRGNHYGERKHRQGKDKHDKH